MNAAERMTVLCADGRKRAGERGDSESWEVWEDLEDLFGQVAKVLENEPEATVRPFVSGMARALAATAAHASRWHHAPAVMADWLAGRDRTGETPGETCAYGDLMRFYGYLDAPYVRCGPDGTIVLEFGDDIDLTDLRDALLKEYPLEKYPPEKDE